MDSGLKKRLLGAAVLIALAVIFVPMLLPSRSGTQSLSTDVPPPPSGELQTRVLQVGPDSARAGSSTAASIIDPDRVASLDLNGGANRRAAVAPVATATEPPSTAAAPEAGASTAAEPEVAGAAPAPSATIAAASAEAEPLPGGAGAAAGTVFTVNLGIYADHGSAGKLVAEAKRHGFTALATPETFQGKSVLRVRVGPFSSKAAAEAARLKLKGFEHVAMSVDAASVNQQSDAPSSALPANEPGAWAVQLAAFSDRSAAEKLRDRLRSQGFDGYVDSVKTSRGSTLWRVRAGPFATREVAEGARGRIADQIKIKGNIVTQN
ncbi:MAG: SPOR domain-containing protein [Rhodanobacteraceae bacterium]